MLEKGFPEGKQPQLRCHNTPEASCRYSLTAQVRLSQGLHSCAEAPGFAHFWRTERAILPSTSSPCLWMCPLEASVSRSLPSCQSGRKREAVPTGLGRSSPGSQLCLCASRKADGHLEATAQGFPGFVVTKACLSPKRLPFGGSKP